MQVGLRPSVVSLSNYKAANLTCTSNVKSGQSAPLSCAVCTASSLA